MKKLLFILLSFSLSLTGCYDKVDVVPVKDDTSAAKVNIKETGSININEISVQINLEVDADEQVSYGLILSESENLNLELGKVVEIGRSKQPLTYSYVFSDLDIGKTYFIRAYIKYDDKVIYSDTKSIEIVTAEIIGVSPQASGKELPVYISTNLKNLNREHKIAFFLNKQELIVKASYDIPDGRVYQVEYPENLSSGDYEITGFVRGIKFSHGNKLKVLDGKWERVAVAPITHWGTSTIFVNGDWVYILEEKWFAPSIFKKFNFKTKEIVKLTSIDSGLFLHGSSVVSHDSKIHFITGVYSTVFDQERFPSKFHYVYDYVADSWTKEPDFPGDARTEAVSSIYNNKIYFGLGHSPVNQFTNFAYRVKKDFWEYDLKTKKWKQLADFPQEGRIGNASFTIDSKMYIVAGLERFRPNKETWSYDFKTNVWQQKSNYPNTVSVLNGFSVGKYGYAPSTQLESGHLHTYRYNPDIDKWDRVADFIEGGYNYAYTTSIGELGLMIAKYDAYFTNDILIHTFKP